MAGAGLSNIACSLPGPLSTGGVTQLHPHAGTGGVRGKQQGTAAMPAVVGKQAKQGQRNAKQA